MSDVDKLAASLLETLRSGDRATTHLGWTVPNVNWEPVLEELVQLARAGAETERRLAEARKTLEVIEEPMHFDDIEAIRDDRVRMQAAARAWLTRDRAALSGGQADKEKYGFPQERIHPTFGIFGQADKETTT